MKLYSLSLTIIIIIAAAAAVGVASRYFLGDDNPIEQVAEEVIEVETGEKVDLSPENKPQAVNQRPKVVFVKEQKCSLS